MTLQNASSARIYPCPFLLAHTTLSWLYVSNQRIPVQHSPLSILCPQLVYSWMKKISDVLIEQRKLQSTRVDLSFKKAFWSCSNSLINSGVRTWSYARDFCVTNQSMLPIPSPQHIAIGRGSETPYYCGISFFISLFSLSFYLETIFYISILPIPSCPILTCPPLLSF